MDEYLPAPVVDAEPPENVSALLGEHTGLVIAAGFGIGLLAGAVIPGGIGGTTVRRTAALATGLAEVALGLGRRAAQDSTAGKIARLLA